MSKAISAYLSEEGEGPDVGGELIRGSPSGGPVAGGVACGSLIGCSEESGRPDVGQVDSWIRKMALGERMIEPFEEKQVRQGVISSAFRPTATTSVSRRVKIFTNIDERSWTRRSSIRGRSWTSGERSASSRRTPSPWRGRRELPDPAQRDTIWIGKSTYARCGIIRT